MKSKKEHKDKLKQSSKEDSKIQQLHEQVEQLKTEKEEVFAKLQRLGADYDNYQKRTPKQIADSVRYEKESIIKSFLPMLDNFEHTLAGAESVENVEVLAKGIKIVYDQMCDILKSHEVQQIISLGEKFDPSLHQAMMRKEAPDNDPNIVVEEFQKGYKLGDRVIRPSKVVVSKLPEEEKPTESKKDQESEVSEENQKGEEK